MHKIGHTRARRGNTSLARLKALFYFVVPPHSLRNLSRTVGSILMLTTDGLGTRWLVTILWRSLAHKTQLGPRSQSISLTCCTVQSPGNIDSAPFFCRQGQQSIIMSGAERQVCLTWLAIRKGEHGSAQVIPFSAFPLLYSRQLARYLQPES